jgi:hypothetical protein
MQIALDAPSRLTQGALILIALVQIILGCIFIAAPGAFPAMLALPAAPAWTDWMFSMLGARALGFAFGMLFALRDLHRHASWLGAMILVQAVDWFGTIFALAANKVTLAQVSTAAFLPVLFIGVLAAELLRQRRNTHDLEAL